MSPNLMKQFDRQFGKVLTRFERVVDQLRFRTICELTNERRIDAQQYKGVYLIEIRVNPRKMDLEKWIARFKKQWDKKRYARSFTNTTKQTRIAKHDRLLDWMPVYIGKSRNVGARVLEHINLSMKVRTTAMKLRARGAFFSRNRFRLRTIPIDSKHYDVWVPIIERNLRNKYNPIVGRQ